MFYKAVEARTYFWHGYCIDLNYFNIAIRNIEEAN